MMVVSKPQSLPFLPMQAGDFLEKHFCRRDFCGFEYLGHRYSKIHQGSYPHRQKTGRLESDTKREVPKARKSMIQRSVFKMVCFLLFWQETSRNLVQGFEDIQVVKFSYIRQCCWFVTHPTQCPEMS